MLAVLVRAFVNPFQFSLVKDLVIHLLVQECVFNIDRHLAPVLAVPDRFTRDTKWDGFL